MSWLVIVLGVAAAAMVWVAFECVKEDESFGALYCLAVAVGLGMWANHEHDPNTAIQRAADNAQEQAEKVLLETPRVIRETDGCRVYEFQAEGTLKYFTRCEAQTTTEFSRRVSSGKGSKLITETIQTINSK